MSRIGPSDYAVVPEAPRYPAGRPLSPDRHEPGGHAATGYGAGSSIPSRRAVVAEPHPRLRVAIEHALISEGYRLACGESFGGSEEPVILFAGDVDGLHVFESCDVAGALADLYDGSGPVRGNRSPALGVHAFVPRPFGVADVLRVAQVVGGFDNRRRAPGP